jgi:hypothetical protein
LPEADALTSCMKKRPYFRVVVLQPLTGAVFLVRTTLSCAIDEGVECKASLPSRQPRQRLFGSRTKKERWILGSHFLEEPVRVLGEIAYFRQLSIDFDPQSTHLWIGRADSEVPPRSREEGSTLTVSGFFLSEGVFPK